MFLRAALNKNKILKRYLCLICVSLITMTSLIDVNTYADNSFNLTAKSASISSLTSRIKVVQDENTSLFYQAFKQGDINEEEKTTLRNDIKTLTSDFLREMQNYRDKYLDVNDLITSDSEGNKRLILNSNSVTTDVFNSNLDGQSRSNYGQFLAQIFYGYYGNGTSLWLDKSGKSNELTNELNKMFNSDSGFLKTALTSDDHHYYFYTDKDGSTKMGYRGSDSVTKGIEGSVSKNTVTFDATDMKLDTLKLERMKLELLLKASVLFHATAESDTSGNNYDINKLDKYTSLFKKSDTESDLYKGALGSDSTFSAGANKGLIDEDKKLLIQILTLCDSYHTSVYKGLYNTVDSSKVFIGHENYLWGIGEMYSLILGEYDLNNSPIYNNSESNNFLSTNKVGSINNGLVSGINNTGSLEVLGSANPYNVLSASQPSPELKSTGLGNFYLGDFAVNFGNYVLEDHLWNEDFDLVDWITGKATPSESHKVGSEKFSNYTKYNSNFYGYGTGSFTTRPIVAGVNVDTDDYDMFYNLACTLTSACSYSTFKEQMYSRYGITVPEENALSSTETPTQDIINALEEYKVTDKKYLESIGDEINYIASIYKFFGNETRANEILKAFDEGISSINACMKHYGQTSMSESNTETSTITPNEVESNPLMQWLLEKVDGSNNYTSTKYYNELFAWSSSFVPFETNLYNSSDILGILSTDTASIYRKYGKYRQPLSMTIEQTNVYPKLIGGSSQKLEYVTLQDFITRVDSGDVFLYVNTVSQEELKQGKLVDVQVTETPIDADTDESGTTITTEVNDEIKVDSAQITSNARYFGPVYASSFNENYTTAYEAAKANFSEWEALDGTSLIFDDEAIENSNSGSRVINSYSDALSSNSDKVTVNNASAYITQMIRPECLYMNYMIAHNMLADKTYEQSGLRADLDKPLYMDFMGNIVTESGYVVIPTMTNALHYTSLNQYSIFSAAFINHYPDVKRGQKNTYKLTGKDASKCIYELEMKFNNTFNNNKSSEDTLNDFIDKFVEYGFSYEDSLTSEAIISLLNTPTGKVNVWAALGQFLLHNPNLISELDLGNFSVLEHHIVTVDTLHRNKFGTSNDQYDKILQIQLPLAVSYLKSENVNYNQDSDSYSKGVYNFPNNAWVINAFNSSNWLASTSSNNTYQKIIQWFKTTFGGDTSQTGDTYYDTLLTHTRTNMLYNWSNSYPIINFKGTTGNGKAFLNKIPSQTNSHESEVLKSMNYNMYEYFRDNDKSSHFVIDQITGVGLSLYAGSVDTNLYDSNVSSYKDKLKQDSWTYTVGTFFESVYDVILGRHKVNLMEFQPTLTKLTLFKYISLYMIPILSIVLFITIVVLLYMMFTFSSHDYSMTLSGLFKSVVITFLVMVFTLRYLTPTVDFIYQTPVNKLMENENLIMLAYELESQYKTQDTSNNYFTDKSERYVSSPTMKITSISKEDAQDIREGSDRPETGSPLYSPFFDNDREYVLSSMYLQNLDLKMDAINFLNQSTISSRVANNNVMYYKHTLNDDSSYISFYTPYLYFTESLTYTVNSFSGATSNYYGTLTYDTGEVKTTGRADSYFNSIFYLAPDKVVDFAKMYTDNLQNGSITMSSIISSIDDSFSTDNNSGDSSDVDSENSNDSNEDNNSDNTIVNGLELRQVLLSDGTILEVSDSILSAYEYIYEKLGSDLDDWLGIKKMLYYQGKTSKPFTADNYNVTAETLWFLKYNEVYKTDADFKSEAFEKAVNNINDNTKNFVLKYITPIKDTISDETIIKIVALKATMEYNRQFGSRLENKTYPRLIDGSYGNNDFMTKCLYMPINDLFGGTGESISYYICYKEGFILAIFVLVERIMFVLGVLSRWLSLIVEIVMFYLILFFYIFDRKKYQSVAARLMFFCFILSCTAILDVLGFKLSFVVANNCSLIVTSIINLVIRIIIFGLQFVLIKMAIKYLKDIFTFIKDKIGGEHFIGGDNLTGFNLNDYDDYMRETERDMNMPYTGYDSYYVDPIRDIYQGNDISMNSLGQTDRQDSVIEIQPVANNTDLNRLHEQGYYIYQDTYTGSRFMSNTSNLPANYLGDHMDLHRLNKFNVDNRYSNNKYPNLNTEDYLKDNTYSQIMNMNNLNQQVYNQPLTTQEPTIDDYQEEQILDTLNDVYISESDQSLQNMFYPNEDNNIV